MLLQPYINENKEQITKEQASLFVNGEFYYDGHVLDVIMVANILCNTLNVESYGQTDITQLKAHIRIAGLHHIPKGATIEVCGDEDKVYFKDNKQ